MSIHYSLFENNLTADPDDRRAQVQITESIDENDLADAIVAGGSVYSREDFLAVGGLLMAELERRVTNGASVTLFGRLEARPTIRGIFANASDSFDPSRHRVVAVANAGDQLNDYIAANATVEKDPTILPGPSLIEAVDFGSGTTNDTLTPGNILHINGGNLKHDLAAADEGVYFIEVGVGTENKIAQVVENRPARLAMLVPSLTPGTWNVQVRARGKNSTILRTGQLDANLTVI